ncbi:C-type lectin-like isoform X2 [Trachinotus anak]|uniref:C-type lectin-like isoform X2 n=1 Tax=Trachinotus anak TaxID=443729 RepID=UPI0039F224D1
MERTGASNHDFDGGLNTLICQEDLYDEEHPPYQNKQQDNKLKDTHLTIADTENIANELNKLQETYKTAIETMNGANKELDSEKSRQAQTNWELEHQTRRKDDYEKQINTITRDIESMRLHLPLISNGCRHCPPGWILMNFMCYYFPFSDTGGVKTWQKARDFCQTYGGDLIVIDSKDKENSTVNYLRNHIDHSKPLSGFWIGLRDLQNDGIWKWLDGTVLVEGYWDDNEPNNVNSDNCAALNPSENFFKAWKDVFCGVMMKWICEKAPTSMN